MINPFRTGGVFGLRLVSYIWISCIEGFRKNLSLLILVVLLWLQC